MPRELKDADGFCAVANLYRAIFRLLINNSGVEKEAMDRTVEREIVAALESVFPQSGADTCADDMHVLGYHCTHRTILSHLTCAVSQA